VEFLYALKTNFLLLILIIGAIRCATPLLPPGGPEDKTGPRLLSITPKNKTTLFTKGEIRFRFDEFLANTDYSKEIFISPLPAKRPEITLAGKELKIKFKGGLLPQTTYVIAIGTGIKDANAQNKMDNPILYAFSTGYLIDTLHVEGNIRHTFNQKPGTGFKVALYPNDSIINDNFFQRQPLYITQTDSAGNFQFLYLKAGDYKIIGFKETDQSNQYDNLTEAIAIADTNRIIISITDTLQKYIVLHAFQPDLLPPQVNKIELISPQAVRVTFNEPIAHFSVSGDFLDTLTLQKYPFPYFQNLKQTECFLPLRQPINDSTTLIFKNITDTANNTTDTTVTIFSNNTFDSLYQIKQQSLKPNSIQLSFLAPVPIEKMPASVTLSDTNKNIITDKIKITIQNPFQSLITLDDNLDTNQIYVAQLDTLFRSKDNRLPKKTDCYYTLKNKLIIGTGTFAGKIETAKRHLKIWLIELKSGQKYLSAGLQFRFEDLPAGEYQLCILEDTDQNGFQTPGRALPPDKGETVYCHPTPILIRPNWEIEDWYLKY
jgi:hypothetical protein